MSISRERLRDASFLDWYTPISGAVILLIAGVVWAFISPIAAVVATALAGTVNVIALYGVAIYLSIEEDDDLDVGPLLATVYVLFIHVSAAIVVSAIVSIGLCLLASHFAIPLTHLAIAVALGGLLIMLMLG